jgi:hypothetical protein
MLNRRPNYHLIIYLSGRWHEHSACALKLPAGNNSAYLARDGCCAKVGEFRCYLTIEASLRAPK